MMGKLLSDKQRRSVCKLLGRKIDAKIPGVQGKATIEDALLARLLEVVIKDGNPWAIDYLQQIDNLAEEEGAAPLQALLS